MFAHIDLQIETVLILAAAGLMFQILQRRHRHTVDTRVVSTEDYLYKIARITGASEYEIFRTSAADWPVSESMVEKHFKDYLRHQMTPCYVDDFIRKHRHQIDNLELPPF